jgi:hypothetical protein
MHLVQFFAALYCSRVEWDCQFVFSIASIIVNLYCDVTSTCCAQNEAAKLMEELAALEVDSTKMARYKADVERYAYDVDNQLRAAETILQIKGE